jgi:uncharacterized membrane protein
LRHPRLVLLLVAVVVMAPSLILGTVVSHSSHLNLMWAAQFADQVRAGVLYPRWLPQSFDNLGAPTFYFYPPLAFWVDALVGMVTVGAVPVSWRLSISATLLLWASGVAMHAWLRRETESGKAALLGSIAYMVAPYHLLDHYLRGALAEYATFALLPLLALGIVLISDGKRSGIALLAGAFAALLMAHLPTALLASVTMLPLYVLFRAARLADRRAAAGFLLRSLAAGVLGAGIAAIYLLPALLLQKWISADLFWTEYYTVASWFLVSSTPWLEPGFMRIIAGLAVAYALLTVALALAVLRLPPGTARRAELLFWCGLSFVCLLLMSGLLPWFWQLPELAKVQFPWRLLVIVEFALVTGLCLVPREAWRRLPAYVAVAGAVALVPSVAWMATELEGAIDLTRRNIAVPTGDSPEYQPAGYPHRRRGAYVDPGLVQLANVPAIACTPMVRVCRVEEGRFGTMRIEIDGDQPTNVTLRRFYFPAWSLEPTLPLAPADPLRLVSFTAPAGRSTLRLEQEALPVERWAAFVSALSLVLLLAWLWLEGRFGARNA